MPTQTLRLNGVGYYQEFETLVDSSHWEATSDQDDLSYVQTQVQGRRDIEALEDPTFGDGINSVTIHCRAYAIGTKGPERLDFWDRLNATDRDHGSNIAVTRDSWNEYNSGPLTTAPDGGGWTKQKIADLQAGIEVAVLGAGETLRVSEIWIVIDYTEVPAVTETIVAKTFPMAYLEKAATVQELTSKVEGATITHIAKDFPETLLKKGKSKELRSKWE